MLNKLAQKRNLVLCVCSAILLAFWVLTLIFSDAKDKAITLILFLIFPFVIYVIFRFAFDKVLANASYELTRVFCWFFLLSGCVSLFLGIVIFIDAFPYGLSASDGIYAGIIIAVLDEVKKSK